MAERLPTGIDVLDRQIEGGIPPGSVVALQAPPNSQSELILQEIAEQRNTLYLSMEREKLDVQKHFPDSVIDSKQLVVRHPSLDQPLSNARDALRQVTNQANIVIDTMQLLETNDDRPSNYIGFLNELFTQLDDTNSIAVLHCIKGHGTCGFRDTTLQMADIVIDLTVDASGEKVETQMSIPKFRGGAALKENIKLELIDEVKVDTSRDIA